MIRLFKKEVENLFFCRIGLIVNSMRNLVLSIWSITFAVVAVMVWILIFHQMTLYREKKSLRGRGINLPTFFFIKWKFRMQCFWIDCRTCFGCLLALFFWLDFNKIHALLSWMEMDGFAMIKNYKYLHVKLEKMWRAIRMNGLWSENTAVVMVFWECLINLL